MDRDTIIALTIAVRVYRKLRAMGVYDMPLELKGLRANALKLQARIDRLNAISARADEKGAMLEGHYGDIEKQLGDHVDDIEFAANILGNSGGSSDSQPRPVVSQNAPPAVQQPESPKPAPQSILAEHEVIQRALADTYRAQAGVGDLNVPKPAPGLPLPQQTPIPPGATPLVRTFRSEVEQQIAAGSK